MNAYQQRKGVRKQKAKLAYSRKVLQKMWEIHSLSLDYEYAYLDLHGKRTIVRYRGGWYLLHGQRLRKQSLINKTHNLMAQLHERELNTPEEF